MTVTTPAGLEPSTRSALTRYRVLAWATGVFLLLLTLHMVLKYGFGTEGLGHWVPMIHGWLYLAYVVVAIDLWFRTRLPALPMVGVVLAGTVPVMSFVAERWVSRRLAGPAAGGHAQDAAGSRVAR